MRGRYHLNLFTPDNYARAFEYFQEAIRLNAEYALAYASLAEYYFALGDVETAFAKLEIAYETRNVWLLWLSSDAEVVPLHNDPRFIKLIEKIKGKSKIEKAETAEI